MQDPKSILLHLDGTAASAVRAQVADRVAQTFDAHVTALYCTTPALMRYPCSLDSVATVVADLQRLDDVRKAEARKRFDEVCGTPTRLTWEESDAPWNFGRRGLCSDLMILGRQWTRQEHADNPGGDDVPFDFVPNVLISSGRPALVLPLQSASDPTGGTVLVAWKTSRESARAVAAAMPWLRRARSVHVVCHDIDSLTDLPLLRKQLAAQGVEASFHEGGSSGREAGELLLSRASDLAADLLVMGCYGHSRSFEWALGGATRTIVHSAPIPVLMVH